MSLAEFEGNSALVTWGTGGIGRAIAEALQRTGCMVQVTGLPGADFESSALPAFPGGRKLASLSGRAGGQSGEPGHSGELRRNDSA